MTNGPFYRKIDYLGHIFDATGVHPNPNNITAILKAPVPVCIKQVQSFIGLCNFYSRFIPNFADHMAPLYALLNKIVPLHGQMLTHKLLNILRYYL